METEQHVKQVLASVLNLGDRAACHDAASPLLGSVPELDPIVAAPVLTVLEKQFGFLIDEDEVDGTTFATVGHLVTFVEGRLAC